MKFRTYIDALEGANKRRREVYREREAYRNMREVNDEA